MTSHYQKKTEPGGQKVKSSVNWPTVECQRHVCNVTGESGGFTKQICHGLWFTLFSVPATTKKHQNPLRLGEKARKRGIHPDFKTQCRRHQKPRTGVSVAPPPQKKKRLCPAKKIISKIKKKCRNININLYVEWWYSWIHHCTLYCHCSVGNFSRRITVQLIVLRQNYLHFRINFERRFSWETNSCGHLFQSLNLFVPVWRISGQILCNILKKTGYSNFRLSQIPEALICLSVRV